MRSYLTELKGNAQSRERLGSAIESGTLPHALLIEGPRGSGKHTLAMELAAALNCENAGSPATPLPCHRCNTCRRIAQRGFTDVKYLGKQSDKATIGVAEVKLFKEDMHLSASESKYKIYVFENAELLTVQAQNALLIALEEPPRDVVIMLLCEQADKLLTTIKSRVQHVATSRFSLSELEAHVCDLSRDALSLRNRDSEKFRGLLLSADGRIGRALELLSPEVAEQNEERRQTVWRIVEKMTAKASYSELYAALSALSTKRSELSDELEGIMLALRDIIAKKARAEAEPLFFTRDEELSNLAAAFDSRRPLHLFGLVCEAYENNQKNANVNTLITELAVKIASSR